MQTSKRHLQHLDVLKGVVIFFVVVGHAFHFGFAYYQSPVLMALRSMDMPVFLFLSGMLGAGALSFDCTGAKSYWLKKGRQLLLPLLTLPTLYALLYNISAREMIWGMMHGGYWFTWVLFQMFVLLYGARFLNHLVNREGKPLVEVSLLVISLCFVQLIDPYWQSLSPVTYEAFSWGKMNYLYVYFLIGYLVGRYPEMSEVLVSTPVQAVSGVAFVLLIYAEYMGGKVLSGVPASLSAVTFAYSTAYRMGQGNTWGNRLLAALGKESRAIYLTHYLFLFSAPMVKTFLTELPRGGRVVMWEFVSSFTYATLVVAVTYIVVRIIKSNALLDCLCYGKRLPRKPSPEASSL